jgi:hypothetical protein
LKSKNETFFHAFKEDSLADKKINKAQDNYLKGI